MPTSILDDETPDDRSRKSPKIAWGVLGVTLAACFAGVVYGLSTISATAVATAERAPTTFLAAEAVASRLPPGMAAVTRERATKARLDHGGSLHMGDEEKASHVVDDLDRAVRRLENLAMSVEARKGFEVWRTSILSKVRPGIDAVAVEKAYALAWTARDETTLATAMAALHGYELLAGREVSLKIATGQLQTYGSEPVRSIPLTAVIEGETVSTPVGVKGGTFASATTIEIQVPAHVFEAVVAEVGASDVVLARKPAGRLTYEWSVPLAGGISAYVDGPDGRKTKVAVQPLGSGGWMPAGLAPGPKLAESLKTAEAHETFAAATLREADEREQAAVEAEKEAKAQFRVSRAHRGPRFGP